MVKDLQGNQQVIWRVETDQAEETLGILLAPDGNRKQQINKMRQLAIDWVEKLKQGTLSRTEMWTALQTTIWRTLCYPLPALNLTKGDCDLIMVPILEFALPSLGIRRNFLRSLVFAPKECFGLGIKHLYTIQDISRLQENFT